MPHRLRVVVGRLVGEPGPLARELVAAELQRRAALAADGEPRDVLPCGPRLTLELADVRPNVAFTDITRFPLARMYDVHELIERENGVEVRSTIRVQGPLAFVWRKLVAEKIVAGLPLQTARLLEAARHG